VTTTISPPIRILALAGILAVAAAAILLFTHSRSSSTEGSTPATLPATRSQSTRPAPAHARKPTTPARPRVALLPGLPPSVARALRSSDVVVVSLFARGSQEDSLVNREARVGARAVDAGFVAVNVLDERSALRLGEFAGSSASAPAVLVVKRPGRIVNRFDGFVDSAVVAQAAKNAGAGK